MAVRRRTALSIAACTTAVAAAFGIGGALAQDAAPATGSSPEALLERLDELEAALPLDLAPTGVEVDARTTWGTLDGDATSVRAVLDTLEPDLRTLFVDADSATGEVADAVSLVAQGWLDVWTGTASLGAAESNDLAFPVEATDDFGVAAGADVLRGQMEKGLELVLQGRARHLDGYGALRALNAAEPAAQARIDDRAMSAETFDEELRPLVVAMLSQPTTGVIVPTSRFETDAPGVRSRATSMTVTCIDREALEEAGGVLTDENRELLRDAEVQREDCPDFPEPLEDE